MKRLVFFATLALAACSSAQQDFLARDAAKQAVRPVLAERFPGIPLEPASDCIIDNATAQEIFASSLLPPTALPARLPQPPRSSPVSSRALKPFNA